jgi:2,4-dienoyl-CoA reductase-like NADH-dependent reductase (Old Yellow Enzyme family)
MRKLDEFVEVSKQLVRADADLILCLEQLRAALAVSYRNPNDKEADRIAKIRANTFCLGIGVRDQIAQMLDEMRIDAIELARSADE